MRTRLPLRLGTLALVGLLAAGSALKTPATTIVQVIVQVIVGLVGGIGAAGRAHLTT
jgi:hypothetical protein